MNNLQSPISNQVLKLFAVLCRTHELPTQFLINYVGTDSGMYVIERWWVWLSGLSKLQTVTYTTHINL